MGNLLTTGAGSVRFVSHQSGGICMDRKRTFWTVFAYLLGLLILGVLFAFSLLSFVPDAFLSVPVGVPWFGVVGAVLISLTGVFALVHDWERNYLPWHVAGPYV